MAITGPAVYQSLLSAKTAGVFPLGGPSYDSIARAVASAVSTWAVSNPSNLALTGQAVGLLGTGNILTPTTRLFVLPNPGVVQAALTGTGFTGLLAPSVATAISIGIASAFTTYGQYAGISASVGSGQDSSVITLTNASTLSGLLLLALISNAVSGPLASQLANGLSLGISNMLAGSSGTGAIVGTPVIPPTSTVGPTFSTVV